MSDTNSPLPASDSNMTTLLSLIEESLFLRDDQKVMLREMVPAFDEGKREKLRALLQEENNVIQELVADAAVEAGKNENSVFLEKLDAFFKESTKQLRNVAEGSEQESDLDTAEQLLENS